jgi:hypothetical protein
MLHPEEKTPSKNETVEMWIKDMMERRAQAIDAINQTARGD